MEVHEEMNLPTLQNRGAWRNESTNFKK